MFSNDTARIKIIYTDPNPAHRLDNVTAIVGGEKFVWAYIPANDVESVIISPGSSQDWQLTLFYSMDGNDKIWESPVFPDGKGYRIEIKIDAQGAVTEHHCYLPCSLD
jgi:hypothetical protein